MVTNQRGFTIVELLIVIVVIAILAAISIVAYNGIQSRAKNTKTINATSAWIKGLKLYEAEKGAYPAFNSCLGSTTTYPDNGACWASTSWIVQPGFLTAMQPYIGSTYPEPDSTNIYTTADPRRGALFVYGSKLLYMMLNGTTTCPDMSIPKYDGAHPVGTGVYCIYQM